MKLRWMTRVVGIAAATATICVPTANADPLAVSFGNSGHFPSRSLIASAPASHPLTATTVHVSENGVPVKDVSVTPAALANAGDFGVILLIDASESMKGEAIQQAMLAARTVAAQRHGMQELGMVAFSRVATTVLSLTSDPARIRSALERPPTLSAGTRIYDATLLAIRQLHDSGVTAGTVIVVSDGADVGSRASQRAVASAALADHVRVFTVGVKDRDFAGRTLLGLAQSTGGSYTASSANGLRQVFIRIEAQLTNRYVVRYRSSQRLGRHVSIQLRVDGLPRAWNGSYASPAAPPPRPTAGSSKTKPATSFWASTLALVLVAFASAVILVGGLLVHLVPRARRHDIRDRIGEFALSQDSDLTTQSTSGLDLAGQAQNWLARFRWWPRFQEETDIAAIERSPAELVGLAGMATVTVAVLFSLLVKGALISLPILVCAPVLLWTIVHTRADRQRRLFVDQLPGHLEQVGSAMRAGHSVIASITAVAKDAPEPTRRELDRAITDEQLGVPLDAALRPVARRMACSDIEQLALVATLNQRTGGNMAEVLELIADGARERADLRRELRALTAQARMSRWIVSALPPAVLAGLAAIRPSYLTPLLHTTPGIFALCLATGLLLLGSFVMRILVPPEG